VTAAILPKISVAIITYNQKVYLEEAIESVLAQDYPNLEIVVADDGSKDGTHDLVRAYAERFPGKFVPVLAEQNEGITANCNRAYFACTGEYIAFLGGDDLMQPGRLRKAAEVMQSDLGCAVCYTNSELFDSDTGRSLGFTNSGRYSHTPREGGAETLVEGDNFICGSSGFVRRSMAPPHGFRREVGNSSDWLFWIESAINGRIRYIPEPLARYRRHATNVTRLADLGETQITLLDLVATLYPDLAPRVRKGRAAILYAWGIRDVRRKSWKEGRLRLLASLRNGWCSWKWFGWYGRALIRR
jgi:glycosyltransferase involved in cell wall biosynthesis